MTIESRDGRAPKADRFEASASMLGYLYQIRQVLACAVERYEHGLDWSVAVEAGDDIEVVRADGKTYYQLKHRDESAKLTDRSSDLWKTLRIWSEELAAGRLDVAETDLLLLTTAEIVHDTIGHYLRPALSGVRDEQKASRLIAAITGETTNKTNKNGYEAYNKLSEPQQRNLLSRIQVVGDAPNIAAIDKLLTGKAAIAVSHRHVQPFLQRLEGWLYRRVVEQLLSPHRSPITGAEFDEMFTNLQNQFRPENLPIDEDIAELRPNAADYSDKTFVRQLALINAGSNRISLAVRHYMRAFEQRSRWLQDGLLQVGELSRYERKLTEAWEEEFAAMEEELGHEATEQEKIVAARAIYRWATTTANYRIRAECDEDFVCKGSFQMLADDRLVGWHIDFLARLMAVLEPAGAQQS